MNTNQTTLPRNQTMAEAITRAEAADRVDAINCRNARTLRRVDAAMDVLVAVVLGAIAAAALLHYGLPCAIDGALCSLLALVKPKPSQASEAPAPAVQPQHPDERVSQALQTSYAQGHDDGEFSGYTEGWRWGLFNGVVIGFALGAFTVFSAYHAGWLLGH